MGGARVAGCSSRWCCNRDRINDRSGFAVGEVAPDYIGPCKGWVSIAICTAGIIHSRRNVTLVDGERAVGRACQVIVIVAKTRQGDVVRGTCVAGRRCGWRRNGRRINDRSGFAVGEVVPRHVGPCKRGVGITIGAAGVVDGGRDVTLINRQRTVGRAGQVVVVIAKSGQRDVVGGTCVAGRGSRGCPNSGRINDRSGFAVGEVVPRHVGPCKRGVGITIGAAGVVDGGRDVTLIDGQRAVGRAGQVIVIVTKTRQRDVVASTCVAGRRRG